MPSLDVGSPAPRLELPTATGDRRSIDEFRGRPVLLSFLGPASCLFCRAHVIKMVQARDAILDAGAEVVLVAYHDPELVMSNMLRDVQVPFVLMVDHEKRSYAEWGLRAASPHARRTPGFVLAVLRLLLTVRDEYRPVDDNSQVGGDFVVDPAGRLAYVKRMRNYYDRAPVEAMIAAARQARVDGAT
jgi:peroxiredoxin